MKKSIILTSLILSSLTSFAQEPSNTAINTTEENVVIIPQPKGIYEDSSEHNRMKKNYYAVADLLGVGPLGMGSSGVSGAYYLNRNQLIVLDYSSASITYSNYERFRGNSFGIHFKSFEGNSFYYRMGVDQRFLKYSYDNTLENTINPRTAEYDSSSTVASFVIGNQWQWKSFTLGCDWIGLSTPFLTSISNEKKTGTDMPSFYKQDQDRYTSQTIAQGMRFYLGASF